MAEPRTGATTGWLQPRRVLLAFALFIAITLLLVPASSDERAPMLSSYSAAPSGARGLYEVLRRVGIPVDRRLVPMREALETDVTYVVLEPTVGLTTGEVHGLLDAVRAGAGLLAVVQPDSRLSDSLGILRMTELPPRGPRSDASDSPEVRSSALLRYVLRRRGTGADSTRVWVVPQEARLFLETPTRRGVEPAVAGLPFGRGRMVVAADPNLFSNSVIRRGEPGVRVVRFFEWLDDRRDRIVVFDEYHHGYGRHADLVGATGQAFAGTPPGRVLLHLAGAGLVLLLAIGVRPVRPRPRVRIERRSPLEHVDALARAYAAARGGARAALLLVRGLRRRHGGLRAGQDEVAYLHTIGERYPDLGADVERLAVAMRDPLAASVDDVTNALLRIEQAMVR